MTMRTKSISIRSIGILSLILPALGLGACTARDSDSLDAAVPAASPALSEARSAGLASTLPAEAGTVLSVRRQRFADGFRQDTVLKGPPALPSGNGVTIVAKTDTGKTLDATAPLARPSEAGIRAELAAEFPHIDMQVVTRASANAYGPYGLAIGRTAYDEYCAYMWQWIEPAEASRKVGVNGPISIRARLCRPNETFDHLATLFDRLRIDATADTAFADTPRSDAKRRPARIAKRRQVGHTQHAGKPVTPIQSTTSTSYSAFPAAMAVSSPPELSRDIPAQAYAGPSSRSQTATTDATKLTR